MKNTKKLMVQINHKTLTNVIKYQDIAILKSAKKLKNKNMRKHFSKLFMLAKYFKARMLKKQNGFWLNKKTFCKGYYFLQKLHKKIGFRLPNNKYKKMQKILLNQNTLWKWNSVQRHSFNFVLKEPAVIEPRLIEVLRRIIARITKRSKKIYHTDPKLWLAINANQSVTRKGRGTRMGTGKGIIRTWVYKAISGKKVLSFKKTQIITQPRVFANKIKKCLPYKIRLIYPNSKYYFYMSALCY